MSEPARCSKCDTPLPDDAPAGLCPKCLVQAGFESGVEPQPSAGGSDPAVQPTLKSPAGSAAGFEPPSPEELAPLFPQLEILELLGKGGMGAVYKARQRGLDRMVAIKILPPEISHDAAFAERFTREARALARLAHPHIVAVYDFGQTPSPQPSPQGGEGASGSPLALLGRGAGGEGSLFYIVMEYVDGVNLRQTIQTGGLTPQNALAIVPQICEALQFAHDEGIVHRDIKPENILIDKKGRVKIADFGLAKLVGQDARDQLLTGTHQVMGTLRYMAPEQMQGSREVDHRADIYSLGVVFYELLTGELPMGKFAPPSKKVQVDVRLDEIVLRALEQEPEQRYQHASDIKTEVDLIRQSPASGANEPVAVQVSDQTLRRRLTVTNLVLVSLAEVFFGSLEGGYLSGADWYFNQELPYQSLSAFCICSTGMCLVFLALWWYLLAKKPGTPRSFADFIRVTQSPDTRTKRLWIPLGIFFGVWSSASIVAFAGFGDTAQLLAISSGLVAGPYLLMLLLWVVYRPVEFRTTNAGSSDRGLLSPPASANDIQPVVENVPSEPRRRIPIAAWIGCVPFVILYLAASAELQQQADAAIARAVAMGSLCFAAVYLSVYAVISLFRRSRRMANQPSLAEPRPWRIAMFFSLLFFFTILFVVNWVRSRPFSESAGLAPVKSTFEGPAGASSAPESSSGWIMGSGGPVLTDAFAQWVLKLRPDQVESFNAALQDAHRDYLALEEQNTARETDAAGHFITTIKPFPGPLSQLENRLWSQLDAILDSEQQSIARLNLLLHAKPVQPPIALSEIVAPAFFGWGEHPVRIELWRVGKWYHWKVDVRGYGDSSRAPQLPEPYRRFWKEPASNEAKI